MGCSRMIDGWVGLQLRRWPQCGRGLAGPIRQQDVKARSQGTAESGAYASVHTLRLTYGAFSQPGDGVTCVTPQPTLLSGRARSPCSLGSPRVLYGAGA